MADYLSFYLGAIWSLLRLPRHDVVMALTTPPLIGLVALGVGRLRRMRVVALVQDVYPDVAVALGTLRAGGPAARLFEWLNRLVLRHADRVVVLGECMRGRVLEKVGEAASERVDVIHNWADGSLIRPEEGGGENPFVREHGLAGRFTLMFSGNFGRVNDFATVFEAARLLREREDVVFLFLGDGAKRAEFEQLISRHHLRNVRLLPYQPRETLRHSLSAADVHFVTLAEGLAGLSVPSKTYGILAAGKPVLFVGDAASATARLVRQNGCGAVIQAGDGAGLASTILRLAGDARQVEAMGRAARDLFDARFDRPHAVAAYVRSLSRCLGQSPPMSQRAAPAAAE